jgi:ankyrin repeat protein
LHVVWCPGLGCAGGFSPAFGLYASIINSPNQLAAGADKEAELHDGGTALNIASRQGHLAVVEALQRM